MGANSSGLRGLSDDLRAAVERLVPEAKKVVGKGCLEVKRDAKRVIRARSRRGYLPHYPRSISYEVKAAGAVITGEIGPDPAKPQGGLGGLLEYGSINNAPIPHLGPALDREEPVIARYLEELGVSVLEGERVDGPDIDPGGD
jgi:hypothetical protein